MMKFEIDTKATLQDHSKWVVEKFAEAKEIGKKNGVEGLKVGHVIAMLFKQNEELQAQVERMEKVLKECVPRSVYEAALNGE
jgi:hypothetical protein